MYVSAISTRFSRGMSTPAILAMRQILLASRFSLLASDSSLATACLCVDPPVASPPPVRTPDRQVPRPLRAKGLGNTGFLVALPLALLVLGIFATDHHHDPLATDHLAVLATRLYRRSHFHLVISPPASTRPEW